MRALAPALAVLALGLPATAGAEVKAPDGDYTGPRNLFMRVSGKSIEILAFDFPCKRPGHGHGRTSLNDIPLEKRRHGYKLSTKTHGIVTYSDRHVDQNGAVSISGQFGPKGKSAHGRFQAFTRHCGPTGKLKWSAERAESRRR